LGLDSSYAYIPSSRYFQDISSGIFHFSDNKFLGMNRIKIIRSFDINGKISLKIQPKTI
jgi:hypothetical protein